MPGRHDTTDREIQFVFLDRILRRWLHTVPQDPPGRPFIDRIEPCPASVVVSF